MADRPPLPERFLQLFLENEYRMRSTPEEALGNLRRHVNAMTNEQIENVIRNVGVCGYNLDGVDDWVQRNAQIRRDPRIFDPFDPHLDSDDSDIDEHFDAPLNPDPIYPIEKVRKLFSCLAEQEMRLIWTEQDDLKLKDIITILQIRRIARERTSGLIDLPFDTIKVIIGFRKVTICLHHTSRPDHWIKICYSGARGRYFVDYEGVERAHGAGRFHETTKYQTLAAKDFFFLVRNTNLKLESLVVDINSSTILGKVRYPFTSFYWKIEKYLMTLEHKIKVKYFAMKFFERPKVSPRTENQGIVMTILPYLQPHILRVLEFRVWKKFPTANYYVDMSTVGRTEQWKNCKLLDIWSLRIRIRDYTILTGLVDVTMILPQEDLDRLVDRMANYRPPGSTIWWSSDWKTDFLLKNRNGIDLDGVKERCNCNGPNDDFFVYQVMEELPHVKITIGRTRKILFPSPPTSPRPLVVQRLILNNLLFGGFLYYWLDYF